MVASPKVAPAFAPGRLGLGWLPIIVAFLLIVQVLLCPLDLTVSVGFREAQVVVVSSVPGRPRWANHRLAGLNIYIPIYFSKRVDVYFFGM